MTSDSRNRRRAYPRAPAQEEWEAMRPEERERVVEELPELRAWEERGWSLGSLHSEGVRMAEDLVNTHLEMQERSTFVAMELTVYYPGERHFIPDLLVVLDVDARPRPKWVVSAEGKGLDWVMEVHVAGRPKKDTVENVKRYAELGIPEYFIFNRARELLLGYRLEEPQARVYLPIAPQDGRLHSEVLGMELGVEDGLLRAWVNGEPLLPGKFFSSLAEVARRSTQRAEEAEQRAQAEARRRAQAEQRAQAEARWRAQAEQSAQVEARRRAETERRVAQLEAELARLRSP